MSSAVTDESSSTPKAVAHFTPAERVARGKAARGELPRSAHAAWEPGPDRADPVDLLEEQAKTRLPELGPIRYGRMLVSPFTFFRGAASLMAADLADGPRTGLHAQLCGDAHLSNFGIFAAPDRRLVFSINDFDETLPGPFEWDLKRLAASIAVAGRDRGFDDEVCRSVVRAAAREYREAIARFAEMRNIDVWYTRLDVAAILKQLGASASRKQMKRFETNVAKVHTKDSMRALAKLCRDRRRRAPDRRQPSPRHADRGRTPKCRAGPPGGRRATHDSHIQTHAAARPAQPARELSVRACRSEGRRGRQRGYPLPGSC